MSFLLFYIEIQTDNCLLEKEALSFLDQHMIVKRKNNRKASSFDLIKFVANTKKIEENKTNETQSPKKKLISEDLKINQKNLQLPKIHSYHIQSVNYERKQYFNLNNPSPHKVDTRFLLMGCQYQKNSSTLRDSKEVQVITQSKLRQKRNQREETIQIMNNKISVSKDNFINRQIFNNSILSGFKISRIISSKKKLFVYVQDGNNSRMIKQILRKRPQLVFTLDKTEAHIVWTQFCDYQCAKMNTKFSKQKVDPTKFDTSEDQLNDEDEPFLNKSVALKSLTKHQSIKSRFRIAVSELTYSKINKQQQTDSFQNQGNFNIILEELHYHNHFLNHHQISDKKCLFSNLSIYCKNNKLDLFSIVPITYELDFNKLKNCLNSQKQGFLPEGISDNSLWFIKPGEDSNRGNGISIASGRNDIQKQVQKLFNYGKSAIVQQYIEPFLYKGRKFDIRCYALVVCFRGKLKAYWYKEGYIRTCSKQYNLDVKDNFAHLTNDAIQKKSNLYGKYEHSNKLSFAEIDSYMKSKEMSFKQVKKNMKLMAYYSIKSTENKLQNTKMQFTFEIFGYDFLIDKKGKVWLIQVNTNPSLQFSGSLTSRVIWHMVDNSFKICLDPLLQYNLDNRAQASNKFLEENRYQCII